MSVRATGGIGDYVTSLEFRAESHLLGGPPRWIGRGAAALGLRGEATPEQIRALAAAEAWVTARVGAGGRQEVSARFVAFEATHPNSRTSDPHLHSHAGLFGVVRCDADGKTRALQSRQVFEAQRLMEAVYQLELGNGLTGLGFAVEARNGAAVASDVPRDLCRAFSSRSERIAECVRSFGKDSPAIRKLAAALTRPQKVAADLPALTARWQALARERGFSTEAVRTRKAADAVLRSEVERHLAAVKLAVDSAKCLAAARGQFTALRWEAEATRRAIGRGLAPEEVQEAVERVAATPGAYGISAVPRPTREPLFTTPAARPFWDRLAIEVAKAATPSPDNPVVEIAAAAAGKLHRLGDAGRALVEKAARSRVVVAVGAAAAGVAGAVKEVWSEYRHPVTRVRADKSGRDPASLTRLLADLRPATRRRAHLEAFKALARQPLGKIADIDSALRFLERAYREARRPKVELHKRSVVVVERCGEATPEQLRELTRRVARAKARLALVERTDVPKAAIVELARRVNRRDAPKPRPVPKPVREVAR